MKLLILQFVSLVQTNSQAYYGYPQEIRVYEQNVTLQYEYTSSRDHCLSHLDHRTINYPLGKYHSLFAKPTWEQWYCSVPSGLDPIRDWFDKKVISVTLTEDHYDPERIFSYISMYFPDGIDMNNLDRKGQERAFGAIFNVSYMKPLVFTVQYKEYIPVHKSPYFGDRSRDRVNVRLIY